MKSWEVNQNKINYLEEQKNKLYADMLTENSTDSKKDLESKLKNVENAISEVKMDKGGHLILS